jgi:hypothetical protein
VTQFLRFLPRKKKENSNSLDNRNQSSKKEDGAREKMTSPLRMRRSESDTRASSSTMEGTEGGKEDTRGNTRF